MERREFCRFLGACTIVGCAGGLTGCARLLDWSAADTRLAVRQLKPTRAAPSQPGTASAGASGSATATSGPAASAPPDLALFVGDDPALNARAAVEALGGMSRFVRKGDRVAIKPNAVVDRAPELGATTNPDVVSAVVKMAFEAGAADVLVFDHPTGVPRNCFEVSGIAAAVARAGGRVKYLSGRDFVNTVIPEGKLLKAWPIASDVFDADVFINIPIAKDHSMAGLTMSMKNLMGVMGGTRGIMHQDFATRIGDLNSLVRPHLIVLDAYRIMVHNGPTGGSLSDVSTAKTCIAGTDPVAVDSLGTSLFGMKPSDLGYLVSAASRGIGVTDLSTLAVLRGRS